MYRNFFRACLCLAVTAASASQGFSQTAPATPAAAKPKSKTPTLDTVIDGVPVKNLALINSGIPINYSEDHVGKYTLPDILTTQAGKKVTDKATWEKVRRPEIVKMFETYQYGKVPPPMKPKYIVFDKGTPAFDGIATRKQIRIYLTPTDTDKHYVDVLVYLPANSTKPAPVLLTINFSPNSSMVSKDPTVRLGSTFNQATGERVPARRGAGGLGSIDVPRIINAGFGIAAVCYNDIEPDFLNGYKQGIRGYYLKPGQTVPGMDEWGAISAWSWGLSRVMDYFETDKQIDAKRIALHGVSRLGKTVLWTGSRDPRYKVVIASCGGEGGAALSRRNFGENIAHMTDTTRYYYQFAPNWHKYAKDFNSSPVDAHMLVSLMAGRYLLLQTGNTDLWSDPHGEFLSAKAAQPVWAFYGEKGPGDAEWTHGGDASLAYNPLGYFMHVGGHGTVPSDWDIYLNYMKKYL